jgi:hypothetical protein
LYIVILLSEFGLLKFREKIFSKTNSVDVITK